jgi:hypothetical protein
MLQLVPVVCSPVCCRVASLPGQRHLKTTGWIKLVGGAAGLN